MISFIMCYCKYLKVMRHAPKLGQISQDDAKQHTTKTAWLICEKDVP